MTAVLEQQIYHSQHGSTRNVAPRVLAILLFLAALVSTQTTVASTGAIAKDSQSVGNNTFTTRSDWQAPTTSSALAANSLGNTGVLKQGGTYHVCASVSDAGSPPSGVSSVKANMAVSGSIISTGQNAAPLSSGSFTCGATSYNYQTSNLTANSTLSEGSKTFQVTSTDAAGNSATTSWSVTVDNTAPTATAFHTVNHTGGTAGKLEVGDQIVFTYSEALNLPSIKSGWNGTSTIITVTLNDNVASFRQHDTVTSNVNLGTIDLGAANYTVLDSVFAASMVWDATAKTITITITSITTDKTLTGLSSTATYIPSSVITDLAGNAINTSTQPTETGKRHF